MFPPGETVEYFISFDLSSSNEPAYKRSEEKYHFRRTQKDPKCHVLCDKLLCIH